MHPVYERIKRCGALPSPTESAQDLLRIANDESATIADIAAVVARDPATASRILKLVNSPLAGLSRKIASIPQAVSLLGLRTVACVAIGFSLIAQSKDGPCVAFDYKAFWSGSVGAGVAARHIAGRLKHVSADELFTYGLLCQIGRLAFAGAFPTSYTHAIHLANVSISGDLNEIERDMYELDHNELAAEMMADWRLPAVFCEAVRLQDSPGSEELDPGSDVAQLARILHSSVKIARILVGPSVPKAVLTSATVQAGRLGLGPELFANAFDSIGHEWQTIGPIFDVATRTVLPLAEIYSREVQ